MKSESAERKSQLDPLTKQLEEDLRSIRSNPRYSAPGRMRVSVCRVPTTNRMRGGATKQELVCHYGDNANPTPIILDYWRGTHYGGGASASIKQGEEWNKVIGHSVQPTPGAFILRPSSG